MKKKCLVYATHKLCSISLKIFKNRWNYNLNNQNEENTTYVWDRIRLWSQDIMHTLMNLLMYRANMTIHPTFPYSIYLKQYKNTMFYVSTLHIIRRRNDVENKKIKAVLVVVFLYTYIYILCCITVCLGKLFFCLILLLNKYFGFLFKLTKVQIK